LYAAKNRNNAARTVRRPHIASDRFIRKYFINSIDTQVPGMYITNIMFASMLIEVLEP
jgi:hypothetical protein